VESIFHSLYQYRSKHNSETVSGPGSTISETHETVNIIQTVIQQYTIKSLLDIPCGDFNWMKTVDLTGVSYEGADIIGEIIRMNRERYERPGISFYQADLLTAMLPKADLIFCRDCLVHFSDKHVKMAIQNIKRSGSAYLLTTTFTRAENSAIVTGSWRAINLQMAPFYFPTPFAIFNESSNNDPATISKSLGLWKIADLPD
jgi:2-polyprenyl-3-methyl-5-hydroxy-6-metoxy-1,4-benzoquinol methylase